jgi:ABC-type multidrug transport system ATPase subunit
MDSTLLISDAQGQTREVPLQGEVANLGGGEHDTIRMPNGFAPAVVQFRYQASLASWTIVKLDPAAFVAISGACAVGTTPLPLEHGNSLNINGISVMFSQKPNPPLFNGAVASIIPLPNSGSLIFGRAAKDAAASAVRVDLDPADFSISGEHVRITAEATGFIIEDISRLGSSLNGDAFSKATLVYGDRLQIHHYTFEFDGKNLRWLDQAHAGAIVARRLTRRVGQRTILEQVSLQIRPGEFVGILGGSGQGKSTLLNALCGLVPASEGEVTISGQSLTDKAGMRKLGIGYVPQDDIVHKELRVRDALLLSGRLRINLPLPLIRARIDRIIQQLGLTEHQDKRITQLSGGQRKRVSIGIELLSNPSVLFLDEPSSGLDPATEERLMVLLQSLALSGITVVCTTHVLNHAFLFNRLVFIQQGRLVFSGNSDEARLHFLGDQTASMTDQLEAPLEKIYSALDDGHVSALDLQTAFEASRYFQAVPAATAGGPPPPPVSAASRKVPAYKTLGALLSRQWKILIADPLNIAFLLAQAVIISVLIAWASDDIGMRAFITVIAAMWFGCSNAAQQIIGEIQIIQRERVCGLGLNTYYFSKLAFLSLLTAAQTFLLFSCTTTLGNLWHPAEFNRSDFAERLTNRITAVAGVEDPSGPAEGGFVAEGDDDSVSQPAAAVVAVAKPAPIVPPAAPSAAKVKTLTMLASFFSIGQNLTESGPRDLLLENGERARDKNGKLLTFRGISLSRVIFSTLGLRILGLLLSGTIGVILGLTVSSLVRSPTQSVMWVPLILIPQILFGGFVIPFPEMGASARVFCAAVPSFASQRIIEVSHIFGSATPFLANRTKTPLFLTSDGSKETVSWANGNRDLTQDYDRISPFNRAWQNLLVSPEKRGKHKHEASTIAGTFTSLLRDSVKQRADVSYRKGTVVSSLAPAWRALLTLTVWAFACYALTIAGFLAKEKSR